MGWRQSQQVHIEFKCKKDGGGGGVVGVFLGVYAFAFLANLSLRFFISREAGEGAQRAAVAIQHSGGGFLFL